MPFTCTIPAEATVREDAQGLFMAAFAWIKPSSLPKGFSEMTHTRMPKRWNTIVAGAGSNQVFVNLSRPIPIFIEYIPVVTKASAQVIFAGDPYEILRENDGQKGENLIPK